MHGAPTPAAVSIAHVPMVKIASTDSFLSSSLAIARRQMPALQGKIAACGTPQTTMSKPDFTPSASALLCPTQLRTRSRNPNGHVHLDHIHIRSTDPEKTAAYYERMFEAEITCTKQDGATRID